MFAVHGGSICHAHPTPPGVTLRLHHVAVFGPHPDALADFYARTLGLPEARRHHDEAGVRSVWLRADDVLLMFERGARGQNGVLVFAVEPGTALAWRARLAEHADGGTRYSLYGRDPDGNRFGVSSFPDDIEASPGHDAPPPPGGGPTAGLAPSRGGR